MPVSLLSSVLLFMTWQREGASLGTSWSSQQCSAVHDMATKNASMGPVGLLSSGLLFMAWQREDVNLSLLIFSAVFCC